MANVVITGSSEGIGLGLAREFTVRGHNVVVSSRSQSKVDKALETLRDLPGKAVGQAGDAADPQSQQSLWNFATAEFSGVDIWINNAGLARTIWPILDTPADQVQAMVSTNMLGTIYGCQVAARGMRDQGGGKIFNMLGGGSNGEYFPGIGIYGTTKRGLDYFTNALIKELDGSGVMINKIRPGMVITEAVIREAKADLQGFEKSRKMMNNMVDHVEVVTPWLVDQMLAAQGSGKTIRWLSGGKITARMLTGLFKKRPDQFARYGL